MEAVSQTVYERGGLSGTHDARVRQPSSLFQALSWAGRAKLQRAR